MILPGKYPGPHQEHSVMECDHAPLSSVSMEVRQAGTEKFSGWNRKVTSVQSKVAGPSSSTTWFNLLLWPPNGTGQDSRHMLLPQTFWGSAYLHQPHQARSSPSARASKEVTTPFIGPCYLEDSSILCVHHVMASAQQLWHYDYAHYAGEKRA